MMGTKENNTAGEYQVFFGFDSSDSTPSSALLVFQHAFPFFSSRPGHKQKLGGRHFLHPPPESAVIPIPVILHRHKPSRCPYPSSPSKITVTE
jgi:hypothetical protein